MVTLRSPQIINVNNGWLIHIERQGAELKDWHIHTDTCRHTDIHRQSGPCMHSNRLTDFPTGLYLHTCRRRLGTKTKRERERDRESPRHNPKQNNTHLYLCTNCSHLHGRAYHTQHTPMCGHLCFHRFTQAATHIQSQTYE